MKRVVVAFLVFSCFLFGFKADAISAKSFVVINGDTAEILYSANADSRMAMASTTKIMTALLLCERGNLEEEITVTDEMVRVEGTSMGLRAGDKITLKDLLLGLMLCSGNDAANAIAITLGGSFENFAAMMNKKAEELGLKNTNFVTPSGLDDENHYTSAYDLAIIARKALTFKDFKDAVSLKSAVVTFGNPPQKRKITNHNKLLKMYDDIIGVKTGFTKKSGRCLVSASNKDDKYVIAVTLNDKNDWEDHRELLDIGLSQITRREFENYSDTLHVINGTGNETSIKLSGFSVCLNNGSEIKSNYYLEQFVYAPIKKGDVVGFCDYYNNGIKIRTENIVATKNIDIKNPTRFELYVQNLFCIFRSINEGQ